MKCKLRCTKYNITEPIELNFKFMSQKVVINTLYDFLDIVEKLCHNI